MSLPATPRSRMGWLLGFLLIARVLLLVVAPHTDPSESRYAEIARKMVETGDWITPQFDYGVPFWAKPPLSIWMSALGIALFGVNEFGSRIFLFVAALMVLLLVSRAARRELGRNASVAAPAFLMGMPLFFFCSAAVMTDIALLLGTTLSMVCFREALRSGSRWSGYGFFAGLAIGLLAKGPLALVIVLPPLAGWVFLTRSIWRTWEKIPWITGVLLMLALSVPWYVAAERKTPGFIEYFLIGEHWKRFTVRGWQGDLYGNAHPVTPGMIWVYLALGSAPWCLGLLGLLPFRWQRFRLWAMDQDARGLYWVLWLLWPVAFFTSARNIIATYPLPALPALALLLAGIPPQEGGLPFWKRFHPAGRLVVGMGVVLVCWAIVVTVIAPSHSPKHSERSLVQRFKKERKAGDLLIYYGPRKYSAEFYTDGSVLSTTSANELLAAMDAPGRCFVALPSWWMTMVPAPVKRRLKLVGSWGSGPSLYLERTDMPDMAGIDPSKTSPIGN
ncbi:ArnT family glycosyltransferase [Luteolibacter luteus]|uniref:Glycosyltransferase family 39 protein n=1 Tax=Luteolibacter luteus TaxID=2728835 RepID=A0A858RH77_9BACT|nr:glycosyltransferase family 39 protein [Luteolibacter luteus]QJE96162.1 glycosyltransferase family 39 protein [Luteolibacter luteus]